MRKMILSIVFFLGSLVLCLWSSATTCAIEPTNGALGFVAPRAVARAPEPRSLHIDGLAHLVEMVGFRQGEDARPFLHSVERLVEPELRRRGVPIDEAQHVRFMDAEVQWVAWDYHEDPFDDAPNERQEFGVWIDIDGREEWVSITQLME